MNIYPIHRFTKRDSNEQAATRTLVIYDKDARVKVKLWDKHVSIPDEMGLQAGDVIKIVKGYVRAGLDGKPVINLRRTLTVRSRLCTITPLFLHLIL